MTESQHLSHRKKLLFSIFSVLFAIILAVTILEIGVRIYESYFLVPQKNNKNLYSYDERLGWRLNDGTFRQLHRDFDTVYSVTHGLRNSRSGNGKKVINFYGDSFCFGTGVADDETVASFVAASLENISVANHGVAGYGPLQYTLNYQNTKSPFLNVFMIYTGNDYQDLQNDRIAWGPYKPYLTRRTEDQDAYQISFPPNDFRLILEKDDKTGFEPRSPNFVKNLLKSIPFVVKIRSRFISPNQSFVQESLKRLDYLLEQIDPRNSIIIIVPSLSLVSNISTNSDEGYFQREFVNLLDRKSIRYIDLLSMSDLDQSDFFPHEGHNNEAGNAKIAQTIEAYLRKNFPY